MAFLRKMIESTDFENLSETEQEHARLNDKVMNSWGDTSDQGQKEFESAKRKLKKFEEEHIEVTVW